ncbi:carbamoyltransferase N-terminal domain-containing protein [Actinokineospora enzanensis]|uniref:carbamoyltransferase N-terminal domain-containing protein n=1 Tax=Actinokineospora enzanensis TaxID=155975 RepID=UPI0003616A5B|nr:carbamoyltransferase N-terminal domain-containing protein [Actinokineospora enzanensis]
MPGKSLICGLKLTHDGAVAVVEDGRLLFSTETEKLENRPRHADLHRIADITAELGVNGVDPAALTSVAVDGWNKTYDGASYVRLVDEAGASTDLDVADYEDPVTDHPGPVAVRHADLPGFGGPARFSGYTHASGHLFAAYCTSPFAEQGRRALVLVWDGGMPPFLSLVEPGEAAVRGLGRVTEFAGGLYPIFAAHFDPFRVDRTSDDPDRRFGMEALFPVSGKAMAYAGLGKPIEAVIDAMAATTSRMDGRVDTAMRAFQWSRLVLDQVASGAPTDAEVLASFQEYLLRELATGLDRMLDRFPDLRGLPLCVSGGCGLNIKWNSGLRDSGLAEAVWVPPFPNDAGSAIGTACAEMVRTTGRMALDWSEFAGPDIRWDGRIPAGWRGEPCSLPELATLLHERQEPVVFLTGRAEVGPRALGHRSIIATATSAATRDLLNEMKGREGYRPVAPVCLEQHAPEVFDPGTRDPYMLFDHDVRGGWVERVPAVVHVDGSARLQTVGPDNAALHELLTAYHARSGIPVLCNTSANHPGRGFFPDPGSAMDWNRSRYVWSEGVLYTREHG